MYSRDVSLGATARPVTRERLCGVRVWVCVCDSSARRAAEIWIQLSSVDLMYLSLLWQRKGTYLLKYLILLPSLTLFLINSIKYPWRKYALVSVLEVCADPYSCRSEEQWATCNTDWISPSPFSLQSSPFQRNHPRCNSFDVVRGEFSSLATLEAYLSM